MGDMQSMSDKRKMYYTISEVCDMTGLTQHTLRYWESEITRLRPKKNRAGNRIYRDRDIELILEIKRLASEEKLAIPVIRKKLIAERRGERLVKTGVTPNFSEKALLPEVAEQPAPRIEASSDIYADIRSELKNILAILES